MLQLVFSIILSCVVHADLFFFVFSFLPHNQCLFVWFQFFPVTLHFSLDSPNDFQALVESKLLSVTIFCDVVFHMLYIKLVNKNPNLNLNKYSWFLSVISPFFMFLLVVSVWWLIKSVLCNTNNIENKKVLAWNKNCVQGIPTEMMATCKELLTKEFRRFCPLVRSVITYPCSCHFNPIKAADERTIGKPEFAYPSSFKW